MCVCVVCVLCVYVCVHVRYAQKYVTMRSSFFMNFVQSSGIVRTKLRRSSYEACPKFVRSWPEVCTKFDPFSFHPKLSHKFEGGLKFVRSCLELYTKLP